MHIIYLYLVLRRHNLRYVEIDHCRFVTNAFINPSCNTQNLLNWLAQLFSQLFETDFLWNFDFLNLGLYFRRRSGLPGINLPCLSSRLDQVIVNFLYRFCGYTWWPLLFLFGAVPCLRRILFLFECYTALIVILNLNAIILVKSTVYIS